MKIATAVKASVFAAALGFTCMLPATVHAQSDVAPDSFPFASAEATAARPSVTAAKQTKADFHGKFSLPYTATCSGKNLKPGQYELSVRSEGPNRVVTIHGRGENVNVPVRQITANNGTSRSALLVTKSGEGRRVEAVYIAEINATLYLATSTNQGRGGVERLPIS